MSELLRKSLCVSPMTLAVMVGMSGAIAPAIQAAEPASEIQQSIALEPTRQGSASDPRGQEIWVNRRSETLPTSDNKRSSASTTVVPEKKRYSLPNRQYSFTDSIATEINSGAAERDAALPTVSRTLEILQDSSAVDSIHLAENFPASFPLPVATPPLTKKHNFYNLTRSQTSISAADLAGNLVAQSPPPKPPVPSNALNLPVFRSLRKPVAGKLLDTGVQIAGIRPKDTSERFWTRDFLTGNWGGERDRLFNQGIDIYLAHSTEFFANLSGGKKEASAVNSNAIFGFDLFTEKLQWWPSGQIHLTAAWLEGASVGTEYVGSLNTLYFADPPGKGPRLFELWYGHKFDQNRGEVRVGKIYPFVRIASSQSSSIFTNQSFDYPTFLGSTSKNGLSAAFAAAPFGIQLSYNFTPQWTFLGQIQDGFDDPSGGIENRKGLSIGLSADEGLEGIFELSYKLNQEKGSTGLPGTYKLGFQLHTGKFENNHTNKNGDSLAIAGGEGKSHRGNYAFYFMAEQMIARESPNPADRRQGLTAFLKTVFAPKDEINTVALNLAGGLDYEGLIPGRDRDVIGIGVSYTQISEGLREFDRDQRRTNSNTVIRDGETVIELMYAAEIAPWWVMIGSIQRIMHPGGSSANPDATVLGVSSRFSF